MHFVEWTVLWVKPWRCCCLVPWFCYQWIAKPGNKTVAPPWLDIYFVHIMLNFGPENPVDKSILVRNNDLAPSRWQTFSRTHGDQALRHHVPELGHNELMQTYWWLCTRFQYRQSITCRDTGKCCTRPLIFLSGLLVVNLRNAIWNFPQVYIENTHSYKAFQLLPLYTKLGPRFGHHCACRSAGINQLAGPSQHTVLTSNLNIVSLLWPVMIFICLVLWHFGSSLSKWYDIIMFFTFGLLHVLGDIQDCHFEG